MTEAVWAVVVARADGTAKSRLASVLPAGQRAELALAMLSDVLDACAAAALAGTMLVTDAPLGRELALARGAYVLDDPGTGMNGAITAGLSRVAALGADAALILPGDVPLATAADLAALMATPGAMVLTTDAAGEGTNGLLLRPPLALAPAFGSGSAARHLAAASAAGWLARRIDIERLAFDVDTPEQLAMLRQRARGATARWLDAHAAIIAD